MEEGLGGFGFSILRQKNSFLPLTKSYLRSQEKSIASCTPSGA